MQIIESALIKNTTREQREEMIKNAFALGTIESLPPSDRLKELAGKYITGELELHEVLEIRMKEFQSIIDEQAAAI